MKTNMWITKKEKDEIINRTFFLRVLLPTNYFNHTYIHFLNMNTGLCIIIIIIIKYLNKDTHFFFRVIYINYHVYFWKILKSILFTEFFFYFNLKNVQFFFCYKIIYIYIYIWYAYSICDSSCLKKELKIGIMIICLGWLILVK